MDVMESLLAKPQDPLNLDMDTTAKDFADLLKTPHIASALFLEGSENFLKIYAEWSFVDVIKKEKSTLAKEYCVLRSSLEGNNAIVSSTTGIPYSNVKLTKFSSGGVKRVLLTETPETKGGDGKGEFLCIYDDQQLLKTFNLTNLDKHKEVYTSPQWGSTLTWSQDGTKLAYLAEKKIPKGEPFLGGKESKDKDGNETARKGEEFAYRQSWGEQLVTCYESVIVVLDLTTEEFRVLDFPEKLFPCDLQWVNNSSLIGTGYVDEGWRLGLIYCSNRESRIFEIGIDGSNFRYISNAGRAAASPRVSPDSNFVIWQERDYIGPHRKSLEIIGVKLEAQLNSPKTLYTTNPKTMIPVYDELPQKCWSLDSRKFFVVTPNELDYVLLEFNMSADYRLMGDPTATRGIEAIHSIDKEFIIASRSSSIEAPSLLLLTIEGKNIIELTKPVRTVTRPVYRLPITGSVSPPSFYYGPSDVPDKSVPLVVMPHGGPHAILMDTFTPETALLLNLGYGVVKLNFVGSTGGTTDTTENLLGKIGVADVQDCQAIVQSLLSQERSLDPSKIALRGGSHGGFLGAHLSSSYPDFYKAIVLINPVTDLLPKVSVSDIPEWSYVELGIKDTSGVFGPAISSVEDARKCIERSPIGQVKKVKGATLLLLGSEDARVVMFQGMAYYRALRAAGKATEVRVYNDCHPLGKVPSRFDTMLHTVRWFAKYLKK